MHIFHCRFITGFLVAALVFIELQVTGQEVFFDDFDGGQSISDGVKAVFSGVITTEPVQGYSGLGDAPNTFGGEFLINGSGGTPGEPGSIDAEPTVLELSGLTDHVAVKIEFLLAIIDTWDGQAPPVVMFAPDYFNVAVDSELVFSETFVNAVTKGTGQSYVPSNGVEIVNNIQLGFRNLNENDTDDAYDMSHDPAFSDIPHSNSTLRIEWFASGSGWQGGIAIDESWAIENVKVSLIPLLGDVNCDGEVNLLDVAPFVDAISVGEYNVKADVNQDGVVNLLDVDPFIALLAGG